MQQRNASEEDTKIPKSVYARVLTRQSLEAAFILKRICRNGHEYLETSAVSSAGEKLQIVGADAIKQESDEARAHVWSMFRIFHFSLFLFKRFHFDFMTHVFLLADFRLLRPRALGPRPAYRPSHDDRRWCIVALEPVCVLGSCLQRDC